MPLFHEPVTRPLRLNCQAVQHTGLANRKVADVDHFLHFAFAFSDDFSRLEGHELAELMFQFAQRVTQTANRLAAHRRRCHAPFRKRFLRARDCLVVIVV